MGKNDKKDNSATVAPPSKKPAPFPVLPVKSQVLFPGHVIRLKLSSAASVSLIEAQAKRDPALLVTATITSSKEPGDDVTARDLSEVGCSARLLKAERSKELPVRLSVLLEGVARVRVRQFVQEDASPFLVAHVETVPEPGEGFISFHFFSQLNRFIKTRLWFSFFFLLSASCFSSLSLYSFIPFPSDSLLGLSLSLSCLF